MDLLLKWITIRFFDTNTTVLLKSIQFIQVSYVTCLCSQSGSRCVLQCLINVAAEKSYQLTEYEASSFIPYLSAKVHSGLSRPQSVFYVVLQLGDKIESVRQSSHDIFRAICKIYPASKVFVYLLEVLHMLRHHIGPSHILNQGLKSKNAKQRQECLVELTYLIERYGMDVCQVGPAKALKTIVTFVAERENSVRNEGAER